MNARILSNIIVVLFVTLSWAQAGEDESVSSYRGLPRTNCLQLRIPIFDGGQINQERQQRTKEFKPRVENLNRQKFMLEEQRKLLQNVNKLAGDKVAIYKNNKIFSSQVVKLSNVVYARANQLSNVIDALIPDEVTLRVLNLTDSFTLVQSCNVCKQWYVLGYLVRFLKIEKELLYHLADYLLPELDNVRDETSITLRALSICLEPHRFTSYYNSCQLASVEGRTSFLGLYRSFPELLKMLFQKAVAENRIIPPDYWRYSEDLFSKSIRNQGNFFMQIQEWGLMGWYMESTKLIPIIQAGD
jgi:hypothetical protein